MDSILMTLASYDTKMFPIINNNNNAILNKSEQGQYPLDTTD